MSGNAKNLRILFFGDITGRQGRTAVKSFIANLKEKPDFVIANIENASHGFGLTKKNYEDLLAWILNNCPPHSRYFSDELGGQIFAKLSN